MTAQRWRWLRGSVDWQVAQAQPTMGTPTDVPVPRKVKVRKADGIEFLVRTEKRTGAAAESNSRTLFDLTEAAGDQQPARAKGHWPVGSDFYPINF
jgi:hypothetical protein